MADGFDLNAALARLPQPSLADVLRAQREAKATPPPVSAMPQPDFRPGGVARFHCPLDCGWHHDENTDPGPVGSLLLPANFTGEDLSAAITSAVEVRSNDFRLRVEQAISDHFDAAHPGR
jgi:hypothetical protein